MDTTGSLLHHLTRRLGTLSTPALLLLAIVLAAVVFGAVTLTLDAVAVSRDPVLMAPFRW